MKKINEPQGGFLPQFSDKRNCAGCHNGFIYGKRRICDLTDESVMDSDICGNFKERGERIPDED